MKIPFITNKDKLISSSYIFGIDGLRALSVIAVICYHLEPTLLPGGFTGVDVFFVISGYVISRSLACAQFSTFYEYIGNFYKRRFLRIFPALVVCLLLTAIMTVLFVPESWLSDLNGKTGVSAFFGLSNLILYFFDDSYFAPRGEFNPFLHTWSLAVEEQFYFFFPFVFFSWLRLRTYRTAIGLLSRMLLGGLFLSSMAFAFVSSRTNPEMAFYLLPARFWELAAGALLYQVSEGCNREEWPQWFSWLCSIAALALLLIGFTFSAKLPFPFPWGGIPVFGAVMLLFPVVQCRPNQNYIVSFLSSRTMTYFGKISYSLYLWHWPVFSLLRWTSGLATQAEKVFALFLVFFLAILSFHFVEKPMRNAKCFKTQKPFALLAKGITTVFVCSIFTMAMFFAQPTLSMSVTRDRYTWYPYVRDTMREGQQGARLAGRKLFILGDSHAGAYAAMLDEVSRRTGIALVPLAKGGCPVLNLLKPLSDGAVCSRSLSEALEVINQQGKDGDVVFLASLRMVRYGNQWDLYAQNEHLERKRLVRDPERRSVVETDANSLIQKFSKSGLQVVIDAPKPVFKAPAFRCSDWFNDDNPICGPGLLMSREELELDRQPVMETLSRLSRVNTNLSVWDPFPILCDQVECAAKIEDKPLFFDGDHLSGYGNRLLVSSFEQHLLSLFGEEHR